MKEDRLTYRSYLQLDGILSAQQPTSPVSDRSTWRAERFFIVCHQTSELWVSQVLLDLEDAGHLAAEGNWIGVRAAVTRAASVIGMLSYNLVQLNHLTVEDFLRFRGALEGASGAESEQLRMLLRGRRLPAVRRLHSALTPTLTALGADAPHPPGTCGHVECAVAGVLDDCLCGIATWRMVHVAIARHFIGDRRGTGGTSGVDHLLHKIAADHRSPTGGPYHRSRRAEVTAE